MEIALTKISKNGQVVIPSQIRRDAKISPATKFLVFNSNGNIYLKKITQENLEKEVLLLEKLRLAQRQVEKGEALHADSNINFDEMDALLHGDTLQQNIPKRVRKAKR